MSLFLSLLLKMSSQAPLRHINVVLLLSETRHKTFFPPRIITATGFIRFIVWAAFFCFYEMSTWKIDLHSSSSALTSNLTV